MSEKAKKIIKDMKTVFGGYDFERMRRKNGLKPKKKLPEEQNFMQASGGAEIEGTLKPIEPEICNNCGFDKNRPRGDIFFSDKNFTFGITLIESAKCKECGHVKDWVETGNNPKTARIIYRNFTGYKEYFENVKQELKKKCYLVLKNGSLGDTLEDMFEKEPQEKPKVVSDVEFIMTEKHGMLCLRNEDGKLVAEKIKSVSAKIREVMKKDG